MLDNLINNISNSAIQDFFRSKISSYTQEEDDLQYLIEDGNYEQFSDLTNLGEAEYSNSDELLVFSCRYNGELSERSSKKKQFEIAKKVLKEDFKDGAVFIFYDDQGKFRFSFIRKNYGDEDKKFTSWRRYTYFVDPSKTNRTFRQRIAGCNFASLSEILEAFSVEPLNKEFYDKIVRSFYSLVGGEVGTGRNKETLEATLRLPGNVTDRTIVRQFGVRLIGRVIFCWFLKHKSSAKGISLIPDKWLSSSEVGKDFYHSKLEQLFFEILNKQQHLRSLGLPDGHELVPFLNGGLFEPQIGVDKDYYVSGKGNYALKIADDWFLDLFKVLEQYNFTIDENSVNDAEVSIDPEMLGRIFENLLAEIDPNLETSEKKSVRKATGSYYTPREIVDYMVEEALVKYLFNQTKISEKLLHQLFGDKEEEKLSFSKSEKLALMEAFDQVKILDPAAGSGAFPMGALHKIVTALNKLDPGAIVWRKKQLEKITNSALRAEMKQILDKANPEYSRKLGVLQQCIYGADIQPIAAEISRLRSFLSLIVDEEIDDSKPNRGILALPNLEFKFVSANTLIELDNTGKIETEKVSELLPELQRIRFDYLQSHGADKEKLRKEFKQLQKEIFEAQLQYDSNMESRPMQLASWEPFRNELAQWFDPEWMFGVKQFDIVIGNPPYGGTKISDQLKNKLGLASKDPYGAFIAKYLRKKQHKTPLKHEGILAFIVSDTFMTIKSHKPLREFLLDNRIHSMIRVHPDTFKATVNTAVILCERLESPKEFAETILMADFTNTSIHERHERFMQLLDKVVEYSQPEYKGESIEKGGVLFMQGSFGTVESSSEYAIYTYPQELIQSYSNIPLFVASPKLFHLMADASVEKEIKKINGKNVDIRKISINDQDLELIKLENFAQVKVGLQTGDNPSYLFQDPAARGNYKNIFDYEYYLLTERDLGRITSDDNLRKALVDQGISKDDPSSDRYFGGRYIVPYDKGGESDSQGGWMPNFLVPTNYFIDWSEWAVERMKHLTTAQRNQEQGKSGGSSSICSRFQNSESYFKRSISFSRTGVYCPTFRLGSSSVFDTEGSMVIQNLFSEEGLLGLLSSRLLKYFFKTMIGHTVHAQIDEIKEAPISVHTDTLEDISKKIISKQEDDLRYDYATNEQLKIDRQVYELYSLTWTDIKEVENWYERRYSKLVAAQKANLRSLNSSSDYIALYKDFSETTTINAALNG